MNILSLYLSHDGCITYIKNNKIIFHTQLDRYNRFKHSTIPSRKLLKIIESLDIDKILITHLHSVSVELWLRLLNKNLKEKIFFFGDSHHHLFHAF